MQDGLYITCVTKKEARASENLKEVKEMDLELLQVCVHHDFNARGVSYMDEGDEQVCYLRRDEVERLLHLPPHIFELLASHEDDEHSDRNMATHLVQFQRRCAQFAARAIRRARNSRRAILGAVIRRLRPPPRSADEHMLVSAHPLFGSSAYVMGNVNEPPRGAPSLELVETQLVALANDDPLMVRAGLTQDKKSLAAFEAFAKEQTEVKMKGTFFVTKRDSYPDGEELTVVYGGQYKRTYSTWGHAGTPLGYVVPGDEWEKGLWEKWAHWPDKCPGWFNADAQPTNRPAFVAAHAQIDDSALSPVPNHRPPPSRDPRAPASSPTSPGIVKMRKKALDGSDADRRLAKLGALFWDFTLPTLDETSFAPPLRYHFTSLVPPPERQVFNIPAALLWERAAPAAEAAQQAAAAVEAAAADDDDDDATFDAAEAAAAAAAAEAEGAAAMPVSDFSLPDDLSGLCIEKLRESVLARRGAPLLRSNLRRGRRGPGV